MPIRERVVNELNAAITANDEAAVAELWSESTLDEKRAVAARQGSTAAALEDQAHQLAFDIAARNLARHYWRAHALMQAVTDLMPFWEKPHEDFTLSRALKTAPKRVAYDVVRRLRLAGFTEEDGLPPLGDPPTHND